MKKCIFCAEEIQDEAIKCKHCGEFLEGKIQSISKEGQTSSSIAHDTSDSNTEIEEYLKPNINAAENVQKHGKVNLSYLTYKKESKFGWGWFVLIFIFSHVDKIMEAKSFEANIVKSCGWMSLIFFYFWFRSKLINSGRYALTKTWKLSFFAGFATYLLLIILVGIIAVVDSNQSIVNSKAFLNEFQKEVSELNNEKKKYYDQLISEPSSESDLSNNIVVLRNHLTMIEKERSSFNKLITQTAPLITKKQDNKLFEQFEEYKRLASQNIDLEEATISSLLGYYITLRGEEYEKYETLIKKSTIANEEFKIYSKKFIRILNEKNL